MKKYNFLIGVLVGVLLVAAFGAGKAFASTGCFLDTNGNWAESAICWLKDNNITSGTGGGNFSPNANVTRAQMAVFLQKQAEIPPSTGNVYINAGLTGLQPLGPKPTSAHVDYYIDSMLLKADSSGTKSYAVSATVPAGLYGRTLLLTGAQVCYNATHGASLESIELYHYAYLIGVNTIFRSALDITSRTDQTCRTVSIVDPGTFWGSDHATLLLTASFSPSFVAESIYINSVTFIMSPSTQNAVLNFPLTSELERMADPSIQIDPSKVSEP